MQQQLEQSTRLAFAHRVDVLLGAAPDRVVVADGDGGHVPLPPPHSIGREPMELLEDLLHPSLALLALELCELGVHLCELRIHFAIQQFELGIQLASHPPRHALPRNLVRPPCRVRHLHEMHETMVSV